jgi:16S rRNA (guanine966-N2)-methyltransferase
MGTWRNRGLAKKVVPVRVIAGTFKGRVLSYPRTAEIRPTMQRTKASVFDSLGARLSGALFVDLFAAAGAMGIEAASRGAARVHFVEHDPRAIRLLEENLEACGLGAERCVIHRSDGFAFIDSSDPGQFAGAIVYADPPYGPEAAAEVLKRFEMRRWGRIGLLMIEHEHELACCGDSPLAIAKSTRFGQTRVTFFTPNL